MKLVWPSLVCGIACASMAASLLAPSKARADEFGYFFDHVFSGVTPSGPLPWTYELFQDISPGRVSLTISNGGLTGSEAVSDLYLNLNPNFDPGDLVFTLSSGSPGVGPVNISLGGDQFKADGDGLFDIRLSYSSATGSRFGQGDYLRYEISGIPNLAALDFQYTSTSSTSGLLAAAHVIGSGGTSSWLNPAYPQVPEPAPISLLAVFATLWLAARWLRRRT